MRKNGIGKIVNAVGVILLLAVIAVMLPLSVPKLFGLRLYGVASGSMEPEYGVGGVVYVAACDTASLAAGDVITFRLGTDTDYVMTHRIASINDEGYFVTKGDANDAEDAEPVAPERVIGKVVGFLPYLANAASLVGTAAGMTMLLTVFAVSIICFLVGDMLKKTAKSAPRPQDAAADPEIVETAGATAQPDTSDSRRGALFAPRILRAAALLMILGGAAYIGYVLLDYHAGVKTYDALEEELYTLAGLEKDGTGDETSDLASTATDEAVTSLIDTARANSICGALATLQMQYPDMIGWIEFENLDISYPIMHTDDNLTYLRHTYNGEANSAGSIFMDTLNHTDFSDSHTIIYGHNMRNLSMFGSLRSYKDAEFYEGNETFMIYTANAAYCYEIFAYYDVTDTSDIYTIWYTPDDSWTEFVEEMMDNAYYDTGVTASSDDQIITLSTCSTEGHRFVIHAKRVETVTFSENQ